jgi:hypothetical protein
VIAAKHAARKEKREQLEREMIVTVAMADE